jgi:hypothetical protein
LGEITRKLKITDKEANMLNGALAEYVRIAEIIRDNRERLFAANAVLEDALLKLKDIHHSKKRETWS